MVAGPWIEPPIIEAVTPFGHDNGDGDMMTHYNVEDEANPNRLWPGITFLNNSGERAIADSVTTAPAGSLPDPAISAALWNGLMESEELLGGIPRDVGGANQVYAFVDYRGTHDWSALTNSYSQHDYWGYNVGHYRMEQTPRTPVYEPIDWPEGAYWVEFEQARPAELLSARISPLIGAEDPYGIGDGEGANWSMFLKPPVFTFPSLFHHEMSRLDVIHLWDEVTRVGYEFTEDDLAVLQSMLRKGGEEPTSRDDRHWLEVAIAWTGNWPGLSPVNEWTYKCTPELALYLTYRVPRYRFLFDTPPYRRIFPRDDGLAGGAPRTYPVSKGVQSSNRIVGGYL